MYNRYNNNWYLVAKLKYYNKKCEAVLNDCETDVKKINDILLLKRKKKTSSKIKTDEVLL